MTEIAPIGRRHDALTVGAIAVIAALGVTANHEALGHGGVCLAAGGQVTLLTSSLFRCSVPSNLIDLGGPLANLTLALIALIVSHFVPSERPGLRLGLILVSAFAGFWEGGYLVQALATRHGDMYSAGAAFIGEPSIVWRVGGGVVGLVIYLATLVVARRGLSALGDGRRTGRIAWASATTATVLAAVVYRGGFGGNLRDAFLEIGLASVPLLLLVSGGETVGIAIRRQPLIWAVAAVVFIAFALSVGRGYGDLSLA